MTARRASRLSSLATSALLSRLGSMPGHAYERLIGLFAAGWGLVALCAPRMFEDGPYVYAQLASNADEWVYGLLFLGAGLAQLALATPETPGGSRLRRRLAAAFMPAVMFAGLATAFGHAGAASGAYTYALVSIGEAVLALRLWFLLYNVVHRNLTFRADPSAFRAFRAPTP